MIIRITLIINFVLFAFFTKVEAQGPYSSSVQGPISPSAASMSFGKYVDTPVDPSTGTMAFSIPIYSLTDGTLSHGLSLSYHTGGIRVSEIASEVGLGWHLNAGGVVSRTVRGLPDDKKDDGYYDAGNTLFSPLHSPEVNDVVNGNLDSEPDVYFYNAGGVSGKFTFDKYGNIHSIPKSDNRIELTRTNASGFVSFRITTPDGTIYHFGEASGVNPAKQETQVESQKKFVDTWYLVKIESADKKHNIRFSYNNNNYKYKSNAECHIVRYYNGGIYTAEDQCSDQELDIKINGKILSGITTSTAHVSFSTSSKGDMLSHDGMSGLKYDNISISNGSKCIRFDLNYDFFVDGSNNGILPKRLKLTQVQKVACYNNSIKEEPYIFEYYGSSIFANIDGQYASYQMFPHLTSKAIDHWGYYNGQTNNENLDHTIGPSSITLSSNDRYIPLGETAADRTSNETEMMRAALKRITYPTKGYTELTYQANEYLDLEVNPQELFSLETCNSNGLNCCGSRSTNYSRTLYQNMINTGVLALTVQNDGLIVNCSGSYHAANLYIYDITNGGNSFVDAVSVNINTAQGYSTIYENLRDLNGLQSGRSYSFSLSSTEARAYLRVEYSSSFNNGLAGGLRVSQIRSHDAINSANDIIRTFIYDKSGSSESSGVILNKPTYVKEGYQGKTAYFSSSGVLPLSGFEGNHITYSEVREYFNGNGHKKYLTEIEEYNPNNKPRFPNTSASFLASNGVLKEQFVYNQNNTLEQTTTIEPYQPNTYQSIQGLRYAATKTKRYNGSNVVDSYTFSQYSDRTGIYRPKKTTLLLDGISTTTEYAYHPTDAVLGPVSVKTTNSNGELTEVKTKYTVDYSLNQFIKQMFVDRNMIGIPCETTKWVNNVQLDGSQTEYSAFTTSGSVSYLYGPSDHPRPRTSKRYKRTWTNGILQSGYWDVDEYFNSYNSYGLLYSYQKRNWSSVTYGYNSDKLLTSTSFNGHTSSNLYFSNSTLLQKQTSVDGTSMSYTYDDLMRLYTSTDDQTGAKSTSSYFYAPNTSSKSYVQKTSTFNADVNGLSSLTKIESREYLDGLGRPIQTVGIKQSPSGYDVVNSISYDKHGRIQYTYEQKKSSYIGGTYFTPQSSWEKSTRVYNSSPLNRTQSSTLPNWYATTSFYGSNSINDAVKNLVASNNYNPGELSKITSKDPDGNKTIIFTDKKGRKILTRKTNLSESLSYRNDTYYIYDQKDRLIEVVPPGSKKDSTELNFFYTYDNEDKVLTKKVPSKALIKYEYNNRDLIKAQQDGYLSSQNQWYVYNYDTFGRETKSGLYFGFSAPSTTSNPSINDLLTENIYGTSLLEKDKIKTSRSKVLGTSNWLTSTFSYDNVGRPQQIQHNNHLNYSTTTNDNIYYDGASNQVKTISRTREGSTTHTLEEYQNIDNDGRTTANFIRYNNGTVQQLNALTYNDKFELSTRYVGGSSSNHLQKVDYAYLPNGMLSTVNNGNTSGSDIFGYRLYYDVAPGTSINTTSDITKKNGNINAIQWAEQGKSTQVDKYRYDYLDRLTNSYTTGGTENTTYHYHPRGNFSNITRSGVGGTIDNMLFSYKSNNGNQIDHIAEFGSLTEGYKGARDSNKKYLYDANGNLETDPIKGVTIDYNHLDLTNQVNWSDGRKLKFTYSADGAVLKKEVLSSSNSVQKTTDYLGFIELENGAPYVIHHAEGRMVNKPSQTIPNDVNLTANQSGTNTYQALNSITSTSLIYNGANIDYEAGQEIRLKPGFNSDRGSDFRGFINTNIGGSSSTSWVNEWYVNDHLGNLRMVYSDTDGNGSISTSEIVQSESYYPYGMKKSTNSTNLHKSKYQYNGIEFVEDHDLDWDMAVYRSLDGAMGIWGQVDPKAEKYYGMTPYNSMGGNPILYNDPNGDDFGATAGLIAIGAATGLFSNGLSNVSNNQSFFNGAGKAALWGGISATVSMGIGSMFGDVGALAKEIGRAVIHGYSSGIQSHLQGGSFGQGFLSGGISSGLSSGATGLNFGSEAMIGIGGLGGGIGSAISGGDFFHGFGQGLAVSAFNHGLHESFSQDPEWPPKGGDPKKIRLAEVMAAHQGGNPWSYYKALTNPNFVQDRINQNVGDLANLAGLFFGGNVGFGWLRNYVGKYAKLHPRLLQQKDAGHRGATFMRGTIAKFGSIRIKDWKTISFSYTSSAGQSFSMGYNPWTRTIYHLAPGK